MIAMENIAERFQQNFPNILTNTYSPGRFLFRHTYTERCNTSARAFARGLFGESASQNVIYEDVPENDWFLRPFEFCPLYDEEVSDWDKKQNAFRIGPEFEEMIEQVNRKLGFITTNKLSSERIFDMWEWCRFETSSTFELSNSETGANSPWCAVFSVANFLTIEYLADLGHFDLYGYGVRNQRLQENLNCGVMQDLLTHMQSNDDTDQMARIFITYAEQVQTMLVLLGSFRDTWPLHQYNYAQQASRHWRTSWIAEFGSNLAVVRYE